MSQLYRRAVAMFIPLIDSSIDLHTPPCVGSLLSSSFPSTAGNDMEDRGDGSSSPNFNKDNDRGATKGGGTAVPTVIPRRCGSLYGSEDSKGSSGNVSRPPSFDEMDWIVRDRRFRGGGGGGENKLARPTDVMVFRLRKRLAKLGFAPDVGV